MITFLLYSALLILAITLANVFLWPRVRRGVLVGTSVVSVLIPARNEEFNLPSCLDTVIAQGDVVGQILIYDDHSDDGTAAVIDRYRGLDPRIALVPSRSIEEGWTGKNFACAQLAASATGRYLLFLDADARLEPGAVNALWQEMVRRNLQFLSCWPGLIMITAWEGVLMPMLNFVVFSIFPGPLSLLFSYPSLALAHGACLLIERDSYRELGGHRAVRDQIFEDTRLAQLWRERGRRGLCLDGQNIVRVRMYSGLDQIWSGFQKNFYPAFKSDLSFWAFILFHLFAVLLPFLLVVVDRDWRILVAIISILMVRFLLALRFSQPLWSLIAHPLAEVMLIMLGITSWWRCKTGRGVTWKGRVYHGNSDKRIDS